MKLLDEMFVVEGEIAQQTVLRLNAAHTIYAAHFPGQPITPGVCLVKLLGELLERLTGSKLELEKIVNLKFVHPIIPNEITLLTVDFTSITPPTSHPSPLTPCTAKGTITADGQIATKFSVIWHTL